MFPQGHPRSSRHAVTPLSDSRRQASQWHALRQTLVERCSLADALVNLCHALDLIHADHHTNPVFVRRIAVGIETVGTMMDPANTDGFWMSREPDCPVCLILAGNALDALSILSFHSLPAQRGCAVVSTRAIDATVPSWIEAWNPCRIFYAWEATPKRR